MLFVQVLAVYLMEMVVDIVVVRVELVFVRSTGCCCRCCTAQSARSVTVMTDGCFIDDAESTSTCTSTGFASSISCTSTHQVLEGSILYLDITC